MESQTCVPDLSLTRAEFAHQTEEAHGAGEAGDIERPRVNQSGLVDGLHARPIEQRQMYPTIQRHRRFQSGSIGHRCRLLLAIGACYPEPGTDHRLAWVSDGHSL